MFQDFIACELFATQQTDRNQTLAITAKFQDCKLSFDLKLNVFFEFQWIVCDHGFGAILEEKNYNFLDEFLVSGVFQETSRENLPPICIPGNTPTTEPARCRTYLFFDDRIVFHQHAQYVVEVSGGLVQVGQVVGRLQERGDGHEEVDDGLALAGVPLGRGLQVVVQRVQRFRRRHVGFVVSQRFLAKLKISYTRNGSGSMVQRQITNNE